MSIANISVEHDSTSVTFRYWDPFLQFANFARGLEDRHSLLDDIEDTLEISIHDVRPDFMDDIYQPQLKRTLESASVMIIEALLALDLTAWNKIAPQPEDKPWKPLWDYFDCFLQHVVQLFTMLQDAAHTMLTEAGYYQADYEKDEETAYMGPELKEMQQATQALSDFLDATDDSTTIFSDFDDDRYSWGLLGRWPSFAGYILKKEWQIEREKEMEEMQKKMHENNGSAS